MMSGLGLTTQKEKPGQTSPHKESKHFESVQLKGLQSLVTTQIQVLCQELQVAHMAMPRNSLLV